MAAHLVGVAVVAMPLSCWLLLLLILILLFNVVSDGDGGSGLWMVGDRWRWWGVCGEILRNSIRCKSRLSPGLIFY